MDLYGSVRLLLQWHFSAMSENTKWAGYNKRRAGTKDETRKSRLIHGPFLRGNKGVSAPPFRPSVASIVPDLFLSTWR